ncbi:XRE family transcriptional regulator, partial [Streptomyces sp. SID7499]|nr:XRE family transcriptional regulator [Streptomyces sp. SID7499]
MSSRADTDEARATGPDSAGAPAGAARPHRAHATAARPDGAHATAARPDEAHATAARTGEAITTSALHAAATGADTFPGALREALNRRG